MKIPFEVQELAKKMANKSQMKFKIGAVIWKKRIMGVGFNRLLFGKHNILGFPLYSIHAEMDAIIGCKFEELHGTKMYVYRKGGRLAKPCRKCMSIIEKVGLKVRWSGD